MSIIVYPSEDELQDIVNVTPDFMYPNKQPYAVISSEYLSKSQCDEIYYMYFDLEPYKQDHCGAWTKQLLMPLRGPLAVVEDFVLGLNKMYWQYDLDEHGAAWLQSYTAGSEYQLHTDTYAGQSRKLTAVVMLSDPFDYKGGYLNIHMWPNMLNCPPAQGTIVVFQSWHQHEVTEVTRGQRHTINMGFWGPPFK